jgi:hypothetical protein
MASRKKQAAVQAPRYQLQSKLRFTPAQAEQENLWAVQLYECRKRFVDNVRVALSTRSPTRRRELYESWRKVYGDDITRDYARYAESVYQTGDTKLLDALTKMIAEPPQPIPDYMILKDEHGKS